MESLSAWKLPQIDEVMVAHTLNMTLNLWLFCAKLALYLHSSSKAVLASLVDSTIDLLAQGILMLASLASRHSASQGRRQFEPLGIFTCSVLMFMAAVLVIMDSVGEIVASLDGDHKHLHWTSAETTILLGTIVLKFVLAIWCRRVASRTSDSVVEAIVQDNQNDVLSNSAALLAAGSTQFADALWISDPIGAILISAYICVTWAITGYEQVRLITGNTADDDIIQAVSDVAQAAAGDTAVEWVSAYHVGPKVLVEIGLSVPKDASVQAFSEARRRVVDEVCKLDDVERCFVHASPVTARGVSSARGRISARGGLGLSAKDKPAAGASETPQML
mmetsp:Transcript_6963/g.23821  ORF Transcript_6963/g.23821 Transcript_6963/m.23821 type:complete len:334 (+) Transcript_6963:54-1055(+)